MGDVYNRGSKDRPVWYCRYKDADGRRKNRPTHMPTKAGAMRFLAQIEERIAGGRVGIPDKTDEERRRKRSPCASWPSGSWESTRHPAQRPG